MSHLMGAGVLPFFDPFSDGVSGDAKGARQSTQAAALFVSSQNLLTPLFGISIAGGVLTAAATTILAEVTLFAIWCMTIADDVLALAVLTR